MDNKLPISCPSCNAELQVKSLECHHCETLISGHFELPILLKLKKKEQDFILDFIQCSGSLKLMAEQLKLSYPTVRNRLNDLIKKIDNLKNIS